MINLGCEIVLHWRRHPRDQTLADWSGIERQLPLDELILGFNVFCSKFSFINYELDQV
jgi:hypothetical protein